MDGLVEIYDILLNGELTSTVNCLIIITSGLLGFYGIWYGVLFLMSEDVNADITC